MSFRLRKNRIQFSFTIRFIVPSAVLCTLLTAEVTAQESVTSFNAALAYDSKYISEGRDNLDEGGIGSFTAEWAAPTDGKGELVLAAWYGEAIDDNYSELNLGIGYGWSLEKIDIAIGYTWLDFAEDDATDNEFSLELGTNLYDDINFGAAFTYSTEAEGTWIDLELSKDYVQDKFVWSPYLLLGINAGYVTDEHDGLNNLQIGLHLATELSDGFELGGYIAYSMGLDKNAGETLDDIFWMGIGVGWGN